MSRPRNTGPTYIPHTSGRGRLQWYDVTGTRREKLLPGPFGSPESLAAKARLELELASSPLCEPVRNPLDETASITVAELFVAYLDFAERHYRHADGKPTSEIYEVKIVIRAVRELYGETPAAEFGPLRLKALRQEWVNQKRSRNECNRRVGMVKRIFKWATSEELVPLPSTILFPAWRV